MHQIFVIEDHTAIRAAYHKLFGREADLQMVGEAATGEEAIEKLLTFRPDLILMDLALPDLSGIELLRQLGDLYPTVPVLVISGQDEFIYGPLVIKMGAIGYLHKRDVVTTLTNAIRQVLRGVPYRSERLEQAIEQRNRAPTRS